MSAPVTHPTESLSRTRDGCHEGAVVAVQRIEHGVRGDETLACVLPHPSVPMITVGVGAALPEFALPEFATFAGSASTRCTSWPVPRTPPWADTNQHRDGTDCPCSYLRHTWLESTLALGHVCTPMTPGGPFQAT